MRLNNPKPVRDASWVKPMVGACLTSMMFVAVIYAMGSVFAVSEPGVLPPPAEMLKPPADIWDDDIWKGTP